MPHLILEFSDNILEKNAMTELFKQCHQSLAQTLPTNIENCKSRAIELTNYYFGTGGKNEALVHLSLNIMPGRTEDVLNHASAELMQILQSHFQKSLQERRLQISLAINELPKQYTKLMSA